MEDLSGIISAAVGLLFLSGVVHFIKVATKNGTLDKNSAIGIRTKITTSSDVAWEAGHLAAGPWLLGGALTGYFMALLSAALTVFGALSDSLGPAVLLVPGSGFLAVCVTLIVATRIANKSGAEAEANQQ
ncbi:SdpI family protein [Nocardiopsis xinjiangensis]|uniref:SdpI family protein n=1 Tax=Nocardiopsis xinjiangensis TaxID=124285 RepID=UPI00037AF213|nr:SdpI family protein [Nocardiopsis xinjiangensis]